MDAHLDRRVLAEILGTFGFFFIGFLALSATVVQPNAIDGRGVALGFGLGLGMMIFAFGQVSGGHFNPAVSLGLACGGRFPWKDVPIYWAAQILGGLGAAALARALFTEAAADGLVNAPGAGVADGRALVIEAVATCLFLFVIAAVATDKGAPWHGILAPVAIGGFVFVGATAVGPFTSGSFNPARSLAPAVISGEYTGLWIFLIGPALGAAVGGLVFSFLRQTGPIRPWVTREEGAAVTDRPAVAGEPAPASPPGEAAAAFREGTYREAT